VSPRTQTGWQRRSAFSLLELLVVAAVVAALCALLLPVLNNARKTAWKASSAHSLRTLAAMGHAYLADHEGEFWKYVDRNPTTSPGGTTWWFGFEAWAESSKPEGERKIDLSGGPLGPYAIAAGGWHTDPAFLAEPGRHKPKFANGNFGFGYNALLGGGAMGLKARPALQQFAHLRDIVVFATCAQVNTFQAPASPSNPLIEEFYLLDENETTVHFRHGGKALAAMLDGSLREFEMDPSTRDTRMPSARVARLAPKGSKLYLAETP
jgi:type II secretory pathway pseudopilin PulG